MKQPKALTRNQKEYLQRAGLDWHEYALVKEHDTYLAVYHKPTGAIKPVYKRERGKQS